MNLETVRNDLERRLADKKEEVSKLEQALKQLEGANADVLNILIPYLSTATGSAARSTTATGRAIRPKTEICPICGEGPFANLGRHQAAKHP